VISHTFSKPANIVIAVEGERFNPEGTIPVRVFGEFLKDTEVNAASVVLVCQRMRSHSKLTRESDDDKTRLG
jgi:hypothetical protein